MSRPIWSVPNQAAAEDGIPAAADHLGLAVGREQRAGDRDEDIEQDDEQAR